VVDAGEHVDQRGFAAARLADDGQKLAALDGQIDAFERGEGTGGRLVNLDDVAQVDDCAAGKPGRRRAVIAIWRRSRWRSRCE
jgi:hypothetical protein